MVDEVGRLVVVDLDGVVVVVVLGFAVVVLTAGLILAGEADDVLDLEVAVAVVVVLAEPVGRAVPVVGLPDEGRAAGALAVAPGAVVGREEAVAVLVEEAGDLGAEILEAVVLVASLGAAPGR